MPRRSQLLIFAFDGPGVTPETVPSVALLDAAAEWFRLLQKVAWEGDGRLSLTGLHLLDKCAAVAVQPDDAKLARAAERETRSYVSGDMNAPRSLARDVKSLRSRLQHVPDGIEVRAGMGDRLRPIALPRVVASLGPASITSLRAILSELHLGTTPSAVFISTSEARPFTVQVTRMQATELGRNVHAQFDVAVEIRRDRSGRVSPIDSHLLALGLVEEMEPEAIHETWKRWFEAGAPEWDDIEDVQAELVR